MSSNLAEKQSEQQREEQGERFDFDLENEALRDDFDLSRIGADLEVGMSQPGTHAPLPESLDLPVDLDNHDAQLNAAEAQTVDNAKGRNSNILIAAVGFLMVCALGAFGYWGWTTIAAPSRPVQQSFPGDAFQAPAQAQSQAGSQQSSQSPDLNQESADLVAALGGGQSQSIQNAIEPQPVATEQQAVGSDVEEGGLQPDDLVVTQGNSLGGQSDSIPVRDEGGLRVLRSDGGEITLSDAGQASSTVAPTEEDALYDKALEHAGAMDLPPGAIKIDTNVINQTVQSNRVDTLAATVETSRKDVADLKEVMTELRGEVSKLGKAIDGSIAQQGEQRKLVEDLIKTVEGVSKKQAADVAALKKEINERAAAQAPVANKSVPVERPAVVATPKPSPAIATQPVAPAPQARPITPVEVAKPVVIPAPQQVASVVAPVSEGSQTHNLPQCDGRLVSSNWRVKGINNSSAYVVRVQDGEGLFVKQGVEVPGYGAVKSFDRFNRTVCTAQGLIRR